MNDSNTQSAGAKLKAARESRNWTQETLANKAGYAVSVIQKAEQGTYYSRRCFENCAEAMGLRASDLVSSNDPPIQTQEIEESILDGEANVLLGPGGRGFAVEALLISKSGKGFLTRRVSLHYHRPRRSKQMIPLPQRSFEISYDINTASSDRTQQPLQGIITEHGDQWGRPLIGALRVSASSIDLELSFPFYLRIDPGGQGIIRFVFSGINVSPTDSSASSRQFNETRTSGVSELTFHGEGDAVANIRLKSAELFDALLPEKYRSS